MNGIFEQLFGSAAAGLIGFGLMIVMFMPKVFKWYKDRRAKKKDSSEKPLGYGARYIKHELSFNKNEESKASEHPDFGESVAELRPDKRSIVILVIVWLLPLLFVLYLILTSDKNYGVLLIIAMLIAFWGLSYLFRFRDRLVFYRTGFAGHLNGLKIAVDYNAIFEYHERPAMIPWMAPTYLLRLEDNTLVVIDGTFFEYGKSLPKKILKGLSARISSQAQDKLSSQ